MSDRTNLIAPNRPIKYIVGSMILLALSGVGMFWLTGQSKKEAANKENLVIAEPTKIILKAKEGEFCGTNSRGVFECEEGLKCNTSKNIVDVDDVTKTNVDAGGVCEDIVNDIDNAETATTTAKPSIAATPTVVKIASISATPTPKAIEEFKSLADGFGVKYKGSRKVYEEKEASGKRYIFYSYSGNITVHVGKTWSWVNSGRSFTDALLIDGEKSYVYEISNQKIVDVEKGDNKFTIQCVHNGVKELKTECDKFLADFYFI